MAIYRVKKDRKNPYLMVNRFGIYDERLSWKAKGLLMYFMSRPDDWEFSGVEIVRHGRDGRDSMRAGIKELENMGYIKRYRLRNGKGGFTGYVYDIYEVPEVGNPEVDTPKM